MIRKSQIKLPVMAATALLSFTSIAVPSEPHAADGSEDKPTPIEQLPTRLEEIDFSTVDYSTYEKRRARTHTEFKAKESKGLADDLDQSVNALKALGSMMQGGQEPLEKSMSFLSAPATEALLRAQLDALIQEVDVTPPEIGILISDSDSRLPLASDLGEIVFPVGFLSRVESEDELHFAMAHEMTHILLDHFKALENRQKFQVFTLLAAGAAGGMAGEGSNTAAQINKANLLAQGATMLLFGPAWDRKQEREADEVGVDILMNRGGSFEGATVIIEKLRMVEDLQKKQLEEQCGGKPSLGNDLKMLNPFKKNKKPVPAHCMVLLNLPGKLLGSMTRKHSSAKKRAEYMNDYWDTRYIDRDITPINYYEGNSFFNTIAKDSILFRIAYANEALRQLTEENNIDVAKENLDKALLEEDTENPKPREAAYHVYMALGDSAEAIRHLEILVGIGRAPLKFYQMLATHRAHDNQNFAGALEIIQQAEDKYGFDPAFYPNKMLFSFLNNDIIAADEYRVSCKRLDDKHYEPIRKQCKSIDEEHKIKKLARAERKRLKKLRKEQSDAA